MTPEQVCVIVHIVFTGGEVGIAWEPALCSAAVRGVGIGCFLTPPSLNSFSCAYTDKISVYVSTGVMCSCVVHVHM